MPIYTSHVSASSAVTSSIVKAYTSVMPDANDGASIGAATTAFSDLFLAEGGVINWDNGDATLTQAGNVVTLAGATFAGTLSTAAQTNITSVGTLTSLTVAGESADIQITDGTANGGNLNNMVIGASNAKAGTFTDLTSTGDTALGDVSGDELTINGSSIIASNMPTGTGNSVVIKNAIQGFLSTDEIDPRVWGTTLLDGSNGTNNELAIFTDANTVEGDSKVTWDGATFAVDGDVRAINYIVSSSITYMTQSFSSGSTVFGDTLDDRHEITGSLFTKGTGSFDNGINATLLTAAQPNITSLGTLGNVSGSSTSSGSFGYVYSSGNSNFVGTMTIGTDGSSGEVTINPIIGNVAAASFTGPLSGNASTATKISSITNSNIVQLTASQTLTNKTLTSPTLTTPALGTPSALVLTNATALPAAQVAQGTMASGMVLVAPALGTPASGVATNLTGTAAGLTAGAVSTIAGLAPNTATTQATQGAITSLGTLTGLTVHGNATIGNSGDPGVHTINGQLKNFSKASGSAVSTGSFGRVEAAKISGTLTTAAQTNITSLGTLGSISVDDQAGKSISIDGAGGGAINGVTLGAGTAATGRFTTLTSTGNATLGSSGDPGVHTINGTLQGDKLSKVSGSATSTGSFGLLIGDGSGITGLTSAAISTVAAMTNNNVITATGAAAVTGEANLTFNGSVLTVTGTIAGSALKDEDNMASDSATHLASQQSIKAYVDSSVTAQDLDATTDSGTIDIDLDSEALTVAGGAGISTSATGTTITIAADSAAANAAGIVELATSAETITGTDAGRAVTPDGLNARIAEGALGNISGSSTSTGSFGYIYTAGGGITAGTILPSTDNAYDLGSASYRFANLYVGDLMMSNKSRGGNEVDGTYGDYTIQEGEEDLYLLNHRNGKTYRFKLEEVDSRPWYKKIFN